MSLDVTPSPNMPRRGIGWMRVIGRNWLRAMGWKLAGEIPNEPKLVIVLAPHTSNWDFFVCVPMFLSLDLKLSFMMKREVFVWPVKRLLMKIGGIPIDRSNPRGLVGQAVDWLKSHEGVWLAITPEGTRKKVTHWKTGFSRIAHEAEVPMLLVGIDAETKTVHIDKVVRASGDHEVQAEEIRGYMNSKFTGINPDNQ